MNGINNQNLDLFPDRLFFLEPDQEPNDFFNLFEERITQELAQVEEPGYASPQIQKSLSTSNSSSLHKDEEEHQQLYMSIRQNQIQKSLSTSNSSSLHKDEEEHQQLYMSIRQKGTGQTPESSKKRKSIEEEESENDRPSKRARTQPTSPLHEPSQIQEDLFSNTLSSTQWKKWTKKEEEQLCALKEQDPPLSWEEIAKHIPGRTSSQCSHHWRTLEQKKQYQYAPYTPLSQEEIYEHIFGKTRQFPGKTLQSSKPEEHQQLNMLIRQKWTEQRPNPPLVTEMKEYRRWTKEEDEQLIELKKQPQLSWTAIASRLISRTPDQCRAHWCNVLEPKLLKKRKSMEKEESENNQPNKRPQTQSTAIPAPLGENTDFFVNSFLEVPRELAGIAAQSTGPSHESSQIQEDPLNILFPPQSDQKFNESSDLFDLFGDNPPQE